MVGAAPPGSRSRLTRNSAICLSTLHAPSPPEPAKVSNGNGLVDEAKVETPKLVAEREEILRLKECGHEFHAECLVSWVVLHKKSCPICRTVYYHDEPEKPTDIEAQTQASVREQPATIEPVSSTQPPVSNWHYFWTGRNLSQQHTQPGVRSSWQQFRRFRS
ncbi:uncharacterized protein EKO05_0000410 [Ascochyta rabiei]|uniref:uncharacterized protein n=1 Tax=Didymella rabiei TaxID=5454 RepID=UPI0022053460|nr:uncharacterized protein EKO05_0000410 [Ascochyta rabiei]UPX09727.1 hypothetical protein EKO05_0000410 [Ascochyta rabiei]